MTQAFNLSQLANLVNSSGQLDAAAGLYNNAPGATSLITANFSVVQESGKLVFKYGSTVIASLDSSGNFTTIGNITAFGTP